MLIRQCHGGGAARPGEEQPRGLEFGGLGFELWGLGFRYQCRVGLTV